MTAGTGIRHSEFNPSPTEPVHLYQIWILPEREGLQPSYEQRAINLAEADGQLRLIAARDGRDGALTIHQDAELFLARLLSGQRVTHSPLPGRYAWLQVTRGSVNLGKHVLEAGDGAAISNEPSFEITAPGEGEILLFDLP